MTQFVPASMADVDVMSVAGTQTITGAKTFSVQPTLPQAAVLGTAVATTSGTAIDFTAIPSWVRRITVPLNGVRLSGTANLIAQIGSGSVDTASYASTATAIVNATPTTTGNNTNGFLISTIQNNAVLHVGHLVLTHMGSNVWVASCVVADNFSARSCYAAGSKTLSGVLDRVRITTGNGTDTFAAGSINIFYE